MRRLLVALFALMFALTFVTGAMAETKSKTSGKSSTTASARRMEKFTGKVDSVTDSTKEVVVKNGEDSKTFFWTDKTKVMENGKEMKFSDLKTGVDVTVEYRPEGGKMMADRFDLTSKSS